MVSKSVFHQLPRKEAVNQATELNRNKVVGNHFQDGDLSPPEINLELIKLSYDFPSAQTGCRVQTPKFNQPDTVS